MECPKFEVRKTEYLFFKNKKDEQKKTLGYYAQGILNDKIVRTSGNSPLELGASILEEVKNLDDLRTIELEDTTEKRRVDSLHGLIHNIPLTEQELRGVIQGYMKARSKYYAEANKN